MKHILEVAGNQLVISRLNEDGSIILYTTLMLDSASKTLQSIAAEIGELVVLDNPELRDRFLPE
jgi:hypothetical protein